MLSCEISPDSIYIPLHVSDDAQFCDKNSIYATKLFKLHLYLLRIQDVLIVFTFPTVH